MKHTDHVAEEAIRAEEIRRVRTRLRPGSIEPLGMPRGSVRAIITLIAISGYAMATGFVMWHNAAGSQLIVPESLTSIVLTVVAFYFGTRANGKETIKEIEGNDIEVTGTFAGEADRVMGAKNLAKNR